MRQGSAPKRGRGRSGGRRGYVNAASRTYDSNGPDVKVRGTAAHIYDKYQALARDASSSGDRIAAENYLQHAEHYFRLMAAAAAAQQQQQQQNGQQPRANGQGMPHMAGGDGDDIDGFDTAPTGTSSGNNGGNGQHAPDRREHGERAVQAASDDADDTPSDGDDQTEEVTA